MTSEWFERHPPDSNAHMPYGISYLCRIPYRASDCKCRSKIWPAPCSSEIVLGLKESFAPNNGRTGRLLRLGSSGVFVQAILEAKQEVIWVAGRRAVPGRRAP